VSADKISPLYITGAEADVLGNAVEGELVSFDQYHWLSPKERYELKTKLKSLFLRLASVEGSTLYSAPFCDVCDGQFEDVLDGLCGECRGEEEA
jgi:hypothetical protein